MLFSEVYSAYYASVAKLVGKAIEGGLTTQTAKEIIQTTAFSESFVFILDNLKNESWPLLTGDYKTPLKNQPALPLTTLQLRFLKTVSLDPRFLLFSPALPELQEVTPLYSADAFCFFDKSKDGDPFTDEAYIRNFQIIRQALKEKQRLHIGYYNKRGGFTQGVFTPRKLEFSEKDDKFRLLCMGEHRLVIINLARIQNAELAGAFPEGRQKPYIRKTACITLEITNTRNALERCLLHFAHFQKETRRLDENHFEMQLTYYAEDETEVLIRVLSFGPMVKVTAPSSFHQLIQQRLRSQVNCEAK